MESPQPWLVEFLELSLNAWFLKLQGKASLDYKFRKISDNLKIRSSGVRYVTLLKVCLLCPPFVASSNPVCSCLHPMPLNFAARFRMAPILSKRSSVRALRSPSQPLPHKSIICYCASSIPWSESPLVSLRQNQCSKSNMPVPSMRNPTPPQTVRMRFP